MLTATVIITSKDRCTELRDALRSCLIQHGNPEILVVNDGSTDGTREMLESEFRNVRVIHHERPSGLVAARNEAAKVATGDVIFSIDDDAAFTTESVVVQTLEQFRDSSVGAIAIPYVDVRKSPEVRQRAPSDDRVWVTDRFVGTAHALRRDVFLQLGGYRDYYVHQGEERDYCLRMLDAGYVVRLATGDLIHHFESPKRDTTRMDLYGRRNDVLFAWLNLPWRFLPLQLVGTSINGLWFGLKVGRPLRMLRGLAMGYAAIPRFWRNRSPVKSRTYRIFRRLQKCMCVDIAEVGPRLARDIQRQS
jgi:glycosyltransferase involved in cell wall biosynthesis